MLWNPFLMKILLKKEVCGSREQCMGSIDRHIFQSWVWVPRNINARRKTFNSIQMLTKYPFGYNSHIQCLCFTLFFFFFSFLRKAFLGFPMGPVHGSRDPQTSFFNKTFIKNGPHNTIYTFKNYFATVFSVFSKISGIQTHLKCVFAQG